MINQTTYDVLPYNTLARRDSHPIRLASIAYLHGLKVAPPIDCKVLEIGSGTGGNLIPVALSYPDSTFTGIDLSSSQISASNSIVSKLGLSNLRFIAADVCDFQVQPESYDYIICHGVYSWVPEHVQQRILALCREALTPNGVAYISYNVYPGWRFKTVLRDAMTFGAQFSADVTPEEQLKAACQFLGLINEARANLSEPYDIFLRKAIDKFQSSDIWYLFHEYLESENAPCYFKEFMQRASSCGLQFLSESKISLMHWQDLPDSARERLSSLTQDLIQREQILDFLRNRSFRETILCREDTHILREVSEINFSNSYFSTDYRSAGYSGDPFQPTAALFRELASGRELELQPGDHAKLLSVVGMLGPSGTRIDQVTARFYEFTNRKIPPEIALKMLQALWQAGLIEAWYSEASCPAKLTGNALISPYARMQLEQGGFVTTQRHQTIEVSESERELLLKANGQTTFEELSQLSHDKDLSITRLMQLGVFMPLPSQPEPQ